LQVESKGQLNGHEGYLSYLSGRSGSVAGTRQAIIEELLTLTAT